MEFSCSLPSVTFSVLTVDRTVELTVALSNEPR